MTTAREMLRANLVAIGADGLVNTERDCACAVDDLAPCEGCNLDDCVAGKKATLCRKSECVCGYCDEFGDADFVLAPIEPLPPLPEQAHRVSTVRAATGASIQACEKALEACAWSVERAIEHIKTMGQAVVRRTMKANYK